MAFKTIYLSSNSMGSAENKMEKKYTIPEFGFIFKNQVLLFFAALTVGICIHFVIMKRIGFGNQVALFDALVSNILLAVLVLILKQIQNNYHTSHPITLVNIAILVVFSFLFLCGLTKTAQFYYMGNGLYFNFLIKNSVARAAVAFLILFLTLYQFWLHKYQLTQQKIMNQKLEIERQLNKAELANIEQQLQPHFLFNSLNSISALTITQPEEARRMVHLLSDFLRGTLRKDLDQEVALKEELHHINLYLEIEKVRFGHRLNIDIQLDPDCEDAKIPALIMQPLIENAIKYGLYGQTGALTIHISAVCQNQYLQLSVSNSYDAGSIQASRGTGFGLNSVGRKLLLLYGQNDLVKTERTDEIFTVRLKIPQSMDNGDELS